MRNNFIGERKELLTELGGLPEPEIINEEWLYILKEETRNSIMIEGVFISEDELEEVLAKGVPLKKNQREALNYFRAAKYFYGMAYENFKTGEFLFSLSMFKQIKKMIFEGINNSGDYRKGDVRVAGAKINPPVSYDIERWLRLYKEYVEENIYTADFIKLIATQHILFETIHPFEDGNGRTGRIILNYLFVSRGYPPIILKGDDVNRKVYSKALEEGDRVLQKVTRGGFDKNKILKSLGSMKTKLMERIINEALKVSLDRIFINVMEAKRSIQLKPAKEVAEILGYSPDSMRTLINRGKFIAIKKGKEWFTHERLGLGKTKRRSPGSKT
ncbi:MAG TPA: Fic family protein [Thermodesulfobacteriota bacterium]|nr:Fic family protein [Thermodesulfobacteriota bacterium]